MINKHITLKILNFAICLIVLANTIPAFADCHIVTKSCANDAAVPVGALFRDLSNAGDHHTNPNSCLKRARDYINYCGSSEAYAFFEVGGAWKTAVVVYQTSTQTSSYRYVLNSTGGWVTMNSTY